MKTMVHVELFGLVALRRLCRPPVYEHWNSHWPYMQEHFERDADCFELQNLAAVDPVDFEAHFHARYWLTAIARVELGCSILDLDLAT